MKKAIASVLAASMALSLAACGGSSTATSGSTATESTASSTTAESTASGDKVTLRMTYWNSEDTVKALLDYLGEAVPDVQIEYQFIDNSNYDTIVDTQLSAGEGPDIICESPASALKHAKLGYLADVSDLGAKFSDAGTTVYSYDGKTYALPGSNGGETNYVRLRDIASLLNGTNAQFGVDWDGNVIIVPDEAYKPNGTEMQAPFSGDRHYQKADAKTVIYGESIPFTAILLTDDQGGGYTYYKLRDLGKVLNFNVGWSNGRGIYIESNHAYEG